MSNIYQRRKSGDPCGRKFHGPRIQQRTTPQARRVETRVNAMMALRRIRDTRNVFSPQSSDLLVGRLIDRAVQPHLQKYFAFAVGQIISTNSRHPTPQEGRIMIVTKRGVRMRWTRQRFARAGIAGRVLRIRERSTARGREMLQRTAKSCGPDAPTLVSSSRRFCRPNRA
jgi:hypothetical protein